MSQENDYVAEEVLEQEDELLEEELDQEIEEDDSEDIDWKARALKAEQAIIKNKTKKPATAKTSPKDSSNTSQVDLLRFNGVSPEEIEQLKKISALEDIDLIDARNSDFFAIWKEKQEKQKQSQEASLSTSRRSSSNQNTRERIERRVSGSDKWTKDDVKAMIHSK